MQEQAAKLEQAPAVAQTRRAVHKVFVRLPDRVLCRVFEKRLSLVELLAALSTELHDMPAPVVSITVNTVDMKMPEYRPVYFSNICGVVSHRPSEHLVRAAVRPYLNHLNNAFGPSMELYSVACNLVIYQNKSSTLFRGGRDTVAIHNTLEHALDSTFIMAIRMHMFVASGSTGRAVCMQSPHIPRQFQNDARWQAVYEPRPENSSCIQIKLSGFDAAWLHSTVPAHVCGVKTLLLILCISGNVNMFLTPAKPVPFAIGVEREIQPLYEFFLDYIRQML
jgi:hypothetical protein|tara:strand:- start:707 stop:1543 length:837 start_codon:yes stop_codon:yes gene_type:complete